MVSGKLKCRAARIECAPAFGSEGMHTLHLKMGSLLGEACCVDGPPYPLLHPPSRLPSELQNWKVKPHFPDPFADSALGAKSGSTNWMYSHRIWKAGARGGQPLGGVSKLPLQSPKGC